MNRKGFALASALIVCSTLSLRADLFDSAMLDGILQKSVDADGYVDYSRIRENSSSTLDSFLARVGDADMAGWSKNERLAFWINAYNARVLQIIVTRPTLKKISDNFELLNIPFLVAGHHLSPNDILFRVILCRKNPDNQAGAIAGVSLDKPDPMALLALATGAIGGPGLRDSAYTSDNVTLLIHQNGVRFVDDQRNVDFRGGHLRLSSFFRWYRNDFKAVGGVAASIQSLLDEQHQPDDPTLLSRLLPTATYQFDWTINDIKNNGASPDSASSSTVASDSAAYTTSSDSSAPEHPFIP